MMDSPEPLDRHAYLARREKHAALNGSDTVSLAKFSPVQPCAGGAYVDMTVWVPDTDEMPK